MFFEHINFIKLIRKISMRYIISFAMKRIKIDPMGLLVDSLFSRSSFDSPLNIQ